MTDTDHTRNGPTFWPWILALLVVALLVWAVGEVLRRDGVRARAGDRALSAAHSQTESQQSAPVAKESAP